MSVSTEGTDPELAVFIAAQAVATTRRWGREVLPEAEEQLHGAILLSHTTLTLNGHIGTIWSVARSPDGKRLATGSGDNTAKVWDAATGKELLTLRGRKNYMMRSVAWSLGGRR